MNLHQKIVEIKKGIDCFNKDSKSGNGAFSYTYVSGSQILKAIKGKMDELGVLLIPEVDYSTLRWEKHEYVTRKNEEKLDFIITAKMTYTWVNAEDPNDKIVVPWICVGQQMDDISKAMGTALTYNERYFLLKFLGLPTDEDDADNKPPAEAKKSKLTDKQINRLFVLGYKAGYERETVLGQILKKFSKDISELTKKEYDQICNGYESLIESKNK